MCIFIAIFWCVCVHVRVVDGALCDLACQQGLQSVDGPRL